MITKVFNRRRVARRVWISLALVAAFAAASCQDKEPQRDFDIDRLPDMDRPLTPTELDSMRAMKITHRVVRDEYWDGRGGVIGNDRVEVWYPSRKIYVIQAMAVLKQMDLMADQIKKSFGTLPAERLVVLCAPNLKTFRAATGRDWWHYAHIEGDTLSMQTPMTLFMRKLLHVAARREYSRWAVGRLAGGKAPQWVVWGMATYLADEREVFRGQRKEYVKLPLRMKLDDMEKHLRKEEDRIETRRAMYNAFLMVEHLVETNGMPAVAALTLAFGEQPDAEAAARSVFNKSYDEVLAQALAFEEPPVEMP